MRPFTFSFSQFFPSPISHCDCNACRRWGNFCCWLATNAYSQTHFEGMKIIRFWSGLCWHCLTLERKVERQLCLKWTNCEWTEESTETELSIKKQFVLILFRLSLLISSFKMQKEIIAHTPASLFSQYGICLVLAGFGSDEDENTKFNNHHRRQHQPFFYLLFTCLYQIFLPFSRNLQKMNYIIPLSTVISIKEKKERRKSEHPKADLVLINW